MWTKKTGIDQHPYNLVCPKTGIDHVKSGVDLNVTILDDGTEIVNFMDCSLFIDTLGQPAGEDGDIVVGELSKECDPDDTTLGCTCCAKHLLGLTVLSFWAPLTSLACMIGVDGKDTKGGNFECD